MRHPPPLVDLICAGILAIACSKKTATTSIGWGRLDIQARLRAATGERRGSGLPADAVAAGERLPPARRHPPGVDYEAQLPAACCIGEEQMWRNSPR